MVRDMLQYRMQDSTVLQDDGRPWVLSAGLEHVRQQHHCMVLLQNNIKEDIETMEEYVGENVVVQRQHQLCKVFCSAIS